MNIVGITSCTCGIAHTYMAREKLLETGEKFGWSVKIETQGSGGVEFALTDEDINDLTTTIQIPKEILVTEPKVISNGLGTDDENNTTIEVNDNNLLTFNMKTLKSGQQAEFEFLAKVTTLDIIDSSIDIFANTFVDNRALQRSLKWGFLMQKQCPFHWLKHRDNGILNKGHWPVWKLWWKFRPHYGAWLMLPSF